MKECLPPIATAVCSKDDDGLEAAFLLDAKCYRKERDYSDDRFYSAERDYINDKNYSDDRFYREALVVCAEPLSNL